MQHLYAFDLSDLLRVTQQKLLDTLIENGGEEKDLRKWFEWCVSTTLRHTFGLHIDNQHDAANRTLQLVLEEVGPLFYLQIQQAMDLRHLRIDAGPSYVGVFDGRTYYLIQC